MFSEFSDMNYTLQLWVTLVQFVCFWDLCSKYREVSDKKMRIMFCRNIKLLIYLKPELQLADAAYQFKVVQSWLQPKSSCAVTDQPLLSNTLCSCVWYIQHSMFGFKMSIKNIPEHCCVPSIGITVPLLRAVWAVRGATVHVCVLAGCVLSCASVTSTAGHLGQSLEEWIWDYVST